MSLHEADGKRLLMGEGRVLTAPAPLNYVSTYTVNLQPAK